MSEEELPMDALFGTGVLDDSSAPDVDVDAIAAGTDSMMLNPDDTLKTVLKCAFEAMDDSEHFVSSQLDYGLFCRPTALPTLDWNDDDRFLTRNDDNNNKEADANEALRARVAQLEAELSVAKSSLSGEGNSLFQAPAIDNTGFDIFGKDSNSSLWNKTEARWEDVLPAPSALLPAPSAARREDASAAARREDASAASSQSSISAQGCNPSAEEYTPPSAEEYSPPITANEVISITPAAVAPAEVLHSALLIPTPPICNRCHGYGHLARRCPQTQCNACGKLGHISRNCHNVTRCRTCHKFGHIAPNCRETKCHKCGKKGHMAHQCRSTECFACHRFGHMGYNCPNSEKGRQRLMQNLYA